MERPSGIAWFQGAAGAALHTTATLWCLPATKAVRAPFDPQRRSGHRHSGGSSPLPHPEARLAQAVLFAVVQALSEPGFQLPLLPKGSNTWGVDGSAPWVTPTLLLQPCSTTGPFQPSWWKCTQLGWVPAGWGGSPLNSHSALTTCPCQPHACSQIIQGKQHRWHW